MYDGGIALRVLDNLNNEYDIIVLGNTYTIKAKDINNGAKYIDIYDERFSAAIGDEGYYVISDCYKTGSHLCRFTPHDNYRLVLKQNLMPIFGVKTKSICVLGIVKTLKQNFYIVISVKDDYYYINLRFEITDFGIDEDITFELIPLSKDDGYCKMAKIYRDYQLSRGACVPLKERIKTNKYLKYAVESPEIRIRLAWKPAPPKVLEQTIDNEPELHVACTFERVKHLIDELYNQGIYKAQICLVGWNKSGHDGRYPQLFPVEEKLGGETKLRELISYAQANGYQIVCHTNSTDCYSIADCFSNDIVCKKADGGLSINNTPWSGGNMYDLCPIKALEFAKANLHKVADLGFRGLHYIDVMSVIPLRECYDKSHPADKNKSLQCYEEIMKLSHDNFGGFSSEGAFDFVAKFLDYALYVSLGDCKNDLFDEEIPLFELVYHGIILYNPSTTTINASIKGENAIKKLKKYGGRPTFYIYSKFMEGSKSDNWLGNDDLIIDTDEQMKYAVSKIKEIYKDYRTEYIKQYEFMDDYQEI